MRSERGRGREGGYLIMALLFRQIYIVSDQEATARQEYTVD
jgi:hypothetical protein